MESLFGIDEDLLAEALILSSSGEAAEWNADKLGLYLQNGTANGAPLYYQMDSGETRYYLFKHDRNWIVGSDPSVNKGSFRNTEPSSSVPTKWWEYFANGEWHHDDGIKGCKNQSLHSLVKESLNKIKVSRWGIVCFTHYLLFFFLS